MGAEEDIKEHKLAELRESMARQQAEEEKRAAAEQRERGKEGSSRAEG